MNQVVKSRENGDGKTIYFEWNRFLFFEYKIKR